MRRIIRAIIKWVKHAILALVTFVGLAPFLLILFTSLKRPNEAIVNPPKWIFTPRWTPTAS